ncbi:MAG: HAMP domain-containing protein [Gammaproteobacteria bacterium]|nr:HAMP domain-containing protein [Gammaproteobacteria bacterium]
MARAERLMLITGALLFLLMLVALLVLGSAMQNSERFGALYLPLLLFTGACLLTLAILICVNIFGLARQFARRIPGSRLTMRMVTLFFVLSLTPVLIVYYFSLDFLHRGIDNWFDLKTEQALDDSLELSRLSLELRMKEVARLSEQMALELSAFTNAAIPFEIDALRARGGAAELTVLSRQGTFIASSGGDTATLIPARLEDRILLQVQQGNSYVGLDSVAGARLSIRAVTSIPGTGIEAEARIVQTLFPFSERVNVLAESVEAAIVRYRELSYLRERLKSSFVLVLTLVLLFTVLSAIWAALFSAQRLAAPVRDLAEGTRAVSAGDYSTQLPVPGNDELGFLVASFNEMTRRIAVARDEVHNSQMKAEAQRAYLENILRRLSSGVLVIGPGNRVLTANLSSGTILGVELDTLLGRTTAEIRTHCPFLDPLLNIAAGHASASRGDWREQVTLFGTSGRQMLNCSGAFVDLPGEQRVPVQVVVFDDITALIQGQKNAAWGEMARRLAHEIKNPLTPIQLAAERLRHKYLPALGPEQSEALNRQTNTIIQQDETMKDMVDTFSDYARTPAMRLESTDLNVLLQEVVDLYGGFESGMDINLRPGRGLPRTLVDRGRIRQVLNNLIANAIEASAGQDRPRLEVSSNHVSEAGREFIEVRIRDSGTGVSEDIIGSMFEPYVTTKQKGTGLGLAIVRKMIDEHNGVVWMENNRDARGACAVIRLPVVAAGANQHDQISEMRDAV